MNYIYYLQVNWKKRKKEENPERNEFSFALSAQITAITQSLSQTLRALGKMRNSADPLRQSRERRRAFDRNKLSLASIINTLYKELYLQQVDSGEQGLSLAQEAISVTFSGEEGIKPKVFFLVDCLGTG